MPAAQSAAPTARTLGRFELRRVLGQGAQAVVWLAYDPRLDREVAVKILRDGDDAAIGDWLHEARNVSRLTHPHIVPVFEADVHAGQPYMVFEYVPGPTLSERLRAQGAMEPREAVQMLLGVLDALSAAHAAALVHRDLKPSNILVDRQGRARVMDFGIAARVQEGQRADARIVGTPGYLSPEAAVGAAPTPVMDVFSAGVVLVEMMSGRPLLRERDPFRALQRVVEEDLVLPPLPSSVDDALRTVMRRAIARDAAQRYSSTAAFHSALTQWLQPVATAASAGASGGGGGGGSGTLEFLLRRMRHKSDFPALSESVVRIQRVASSENESLGSLAGEILKDVALTNKLLRIVNTAQFSHAGGGSISTVSRAVQLIGFAGIRNMALSLVLLEHMSDKAHANQLKEEFLRSLMAGSLADELCVVARHSEEAFIGAMFQNLGRLLTEYYFAEEAREIRSRVQAPAARAVPEEQASLAVLGLSYEQLGLGVARNWGLPDALQRCMTVPEGDPPTQLPERDRLRWLATAANKVADALLLCEPDEAASRIAELADTYAKPLGLAAKDLQKAADRAQDRLARTAEAMGLHVPNGARARRLLERGTQAQHAGIASESAASAGSAVSGSSDRTVVLATRDSVSQSPSIATAASEMLAAGIQEVTDLLAGDQCKLNIALSMIIGVIHRALGVRRVIFCLRDPKAEALTARFGVGDELEVALGCFKVPMRRGASSPSDLISAVCCKGVDTLISDASAPNVATRLPTWFAAKLRPSSFLLLPLSMRDAPFALIYADRTEGSLALGEKELNMLRTLRNQALMAFRQAGS